MPADELRDFANRFAQLADAPIAADLAGTLADLRRCGDAPHDGQRHPPVGAAHTRRVSHRFRIEGCRRVGSRHPVRRIGPQLRQQVDATKQVSRKQGMDAAAALAEGQIGVRVEQSMQRMLTSGGVWKPIRAR